MIARHVARHTRMVAAEATRGYAAGRGQGRKPTPEPFYHSARPGEGANVQTSRPTAEPQPSHTAETGIASSNTSATGASSSTTSSSVPPSVPPTSGTSPVRSSGATGSDSSQGVGTSQNPAGTPLPPKRNSSGTPVALATLVGAGVGAYAYYTSEENALLPPKAVAPDTTTAAVAEKTTQADTDSKKDKPLASDTALKPVALSAARRLFGKEKEEAEKKESLVSVSAQTLSAPAPAPKKEKTPTPPPVKPVKVDISKQAEEVFHNAADALLAATGAAADAARRADEKETAARRMSSQTSEKSSGDSSLAGPALAARAAALESVAQKFSKDSKHGKEIRARSRAAEKEMASLTPTALVAASFQGAAEDIEQKSAAFRAMTFQAESDAKAFAQTLERVQVDSRRELHKLEVMLRQEHAEAAEVASKQMSALAHEIDQSERRVASLASALSTAGEDAEKLADETAKEFEHTLKRSLETQALELKKAAAKCLIKERVERIEQLDEARVQLGALTETLSVNSDNLKMSHKQLRVVMSVNALADAAVRGEGVVDRVEVLKTVAEDDPLVQAVVNAIPTRAKERGTPTTAQLTNRLEDVVRTARRLKLVPENKGSNGGGVLTYVVSGIASLLRVKERPDESDVTGIEAALALALNAMGEGKLAAAAEFLELGVAGSDAQRLCQGWVQDARERQRLEMAITTLRAHIAVETATLA